MSGNEFDYFKFAKDYSDNVVDNAEKERIQNRFNYYNCIISTIALILSIISIILKN